MGNAYTKQEIKEWKARLQAERKKLLKALRKVGVLHVSGSFDGWLDNGNIGDIHFRPEIEDKHKAIDLEKRIGDYVWGWANLFCPGWQDEGGGYGYLDWSIHFDVSEITFQAREITTPKRRKERF